MDEFGGILGNHPHDAYFEQVFKIREVALQLIRQFMPQNQQQILNLDTLEISSISFVKKYPHIYANTIAFVR